MLLVAAHRIIDLELAGRMRHCLAVVELRVRMKTVDAGTGEELSRGDLVKGFAISRDEYVLLDKEDFESVKLESTRIIDIEKFVARETIDRLYWDALYRLVPSGKTGIEEKKKGKPVKSQPVREEADSGVVELMAALKSSLQGDGPERKRAERYAAAAGANKKKPWPRGRKAA